MCPYLNSPGLNVRQSPMSQLLQEAKTDSSKGRQEGWKEGGGRTYTPRNKQSMKINKKQQHTDISLAGSVIVKTLQRKKTRWHNKGRFVCLLKALRNPVQDRRVKGKCAFGLKNSSMSVGREHSHALPLVARHQPRLPPRTRAPRETRSGAPNVEN